MLIGGPPPFMKDFVRKANEEIKRLEPGNVLPSFLVPITPEATISEGSMPNMPDPGVTKRNKSEEQNKKSGKKTRLHRKPPMNPDYPTKQDIAPDLPRRFASDPENGKNNGNVIEIFGSRI